MDIFFTPLQFFEEGSGFAMGSPLHLLYIAIVLVAIVATVAIYLHLPKGLAWGQPRRRMMVAVPALIIILKAIELTIMNVRGVYNIYWAPLHPCNVCAVFMLVYALLPREGGALEQNVRHAFEGLSYVLGLVGSPFAILFPNWISRSPHVLNYFCMAGFVEHALLIGFVIMLLAGGDLRPRLRNIWQSIIVVFICAGLAYCFNAYNGTNYWFVTVPSPGSPLELMASYWGVPGYLVPYAIIAIAAWFACYLPFEIGARCRARRDGGSAQ